MTMDTHEARRRVQEDPDYVDLKRWDYSLEKVVNHYPEGAPDRLVATALMITEDDVETCYQQIVLKLRNAMKVEVDA